MARIVLLVLWVLSCWTFCDGECTVSAIKALQTTSIDTAKLDGHWYVTHLFGDMSSDTSYTVDVVPTLQGLTIYSSRNISGGGECLYKAVELNATAESGHFISSLSDPVQTLVVAASDGVNFALLYYCGGHVSDTENCDNAMAMVVGRQPDTAAAAAWLQSVSTSLPCFEQASAVVVQQSKPECPFKPLWSLPGRECRVDTFPVQKDFDLSRYLGVWWEMAWLAPFYIPGHELFADYRHRYVLSDDGNITCHVAGRNTQGQCFFYNISVLMTRTPGRMIFNETSGPTPYNVVRVEYDMYAVVHGCRDKNATTGECITARSWLWSRDVTLDRQRRLAANSLLQNLCVNPSSLLTTEQSNECREVTGAGGGFGVSVTVLVTSLLMCLSLSS